MAAKSKKFDKVKDWFEKRFWTLSMVHDAVGKHWITAAEYREITGETYHK